MAKICQCCGQPIPETRHGVVLPAMKTRIFDLVKRSPGINRAELSKIVYNTNTDVSRRNIGIHIHQINQYFLDGPVRIHGLRGYGYSIKATGGHTDYRPRQINSRIAR